MQNACSKHFPAIIARRAIGRQDCVRSAQEECARCLRRPLCPPREAELQARRCSRSGTAAAARHCHHSGATCVHSCYCHSHFLGFIFVLLMFSFLVSPTILNLVGVFFCDLLASLWNSC